MFQLSNPGARAITAAALLGMIFVAGPASAATRDGTVTLAQAAPTTPPPPPAGQPPATPPPQVSAHSPVANVEARIKELHRRLHITKAEEPQWESVAGVMRSNAQAMEALVHERYENAAKMTAVDDLRSYSALADAHADGLKKFVPVFEQLYDSMSDKQKKTADVLFRNRLRQHAAAEPKPKAQ